MKAKNLQTGEIADNFGVSKEFGTISYTDSEGVLQFASPRSDEWQILKEESASEIMMFDKQQFKELLEGYAPDKRTQAAISAINGILANYDQFSHIIADAYEEGESHLIPDGVAKFAVACADALMARLSKEAGEGSESEKEK